MQVLGQVRAFVWSSFGLPKVRNQQEEETRKGQEVEKEQEEKAKKEQRAAGGERGRRWRSRQEAREQQGAAWP
jgi:hypothetical protein